MRVPMPRLSGTYPGEERRPPLRALGSRREPSSARAGVRKRNARCGRSGGRALRRLPIQLQKPGGFLGRAAEVGEVAVEVSRSEARAHYGSSRQHQEGTAKNPRNGAERSEISGGYVAGGAKRQRREDGQRRNRPGLESRRARRTRIGSLVRSTDATRDGKRWRGTKPHERRSYTLGAHGAIRARWMSIGRRRVGR